MIFKELEVKQSEGITNVNAQNLVQRAMRYDSEIMFEQGTRKINAKSLMGVLAMGLKKGDKVMIIVKGDDQEDALKDIALLFDRNFKL